MACLEIFWQVMSCTLPFPRHCTDPTTKGWISPDTCVQIVNGKKPAIDVPGIILICHGLAPNQLKPPKSMDFPCLPAEEKPRIPSTECFGDCHVAGYFAWDVLTASYVLWPEIFDSEMERIGVCVEGERQGAIYRKVEGGSAVRVLTRVDAAQWEDRLVRALCSNTVSSGTL